MGRIGRIAAALALALGLLAPALASAQEMGLGLGLALGRGVFAQPIAMQVLSTGWQADITWNTVSCASVTSAYALTPDATPKVSLAVTSPGFTTTGAVTTINRTVVATIWLRQVYANETLPTESAVGAGCKTRVALSDYVNVNDTASATFLAGAYTHGSASPARASVAVLNSSTQVHPVPIANWVTQPYQVIEAGSPFTVEAAAFFARPQGGKQVNAVKFDATDGTNHATCTSSTMTQSAVSTGGNPAYVYSCTFAAGAFAGLTAGSCASGVTCSISLNFTAYPAVGDQTISSATGQDGVAITAATQSVSLKPILAVFDQQANYTPAYAWVSSTGTCVTAACVSTSATDPGTGASANFASIEKALAGCKLFNNARTHAHNDIAACLVYVRASASPVNGFDPTTSVTGLTAGATWAKIDGAPGTTPSTVVWKLLASGTGQNTLQNRMEFDNFGFAQVDTTSSAYNVALQGADTGTSTMNTEFMCNGCVWTATTASDWPMLYSTGIPRWLNSTLDASSAGSGYFFITYGGTRVAPVLLGDTIKGHNGTHDIVIPYEMLGNALTQMTMEGPVTTASSLPPTGLIWAFNTFYNATVPTQISASSGLDGGPGNVAAVQNIYEKTTVDAGYGLYFLPDADDTPVVNFVEQYDTIVGARRNWCYNDGTAPGGGAESTPKQCLSLYVAFGHMGTGAPQGTNVKADTFVAPVVGANGARIGNWMVRFGVGSVGNVWFESGEGAAAPGPDTFMGDYVGLTGSTTPNNEGYNNILAFTNDQSAGGSNGGNGTYTITGGTGSAAYGRVPSGFAGLPDDIAGVARKNDGTGCAGAYESC
jgi:hypothetical protein